VKTYSGSSVYFRQSAFFLRNCRMSVGEILKNKSRPKKLSKLSFDSVRYHISPTLYKISKI
jgi:hypothetical protein